MGLGQKPLLVTDLSTNTQLLWQNQVVALLIGQPPTPWSVRGVLTGWSTLLVP